MNAVAVDRQATCTVRRELRTGRLLVRWQASGERWRELYADFRRTFPAHRQATYRTTERCWSLPIGERERLEAWIDAQGLVLEGEDLAGHLAVVGVGTGGRGR